MTLKYRHQDPLLQGRVERICLNKKFVESLYASIRYNLCKYWDNKKNAHIQKVCVPRNILTQAFKNIM